MSCHLADAFIQSDLQLIRLSRRHTPWSNVGLRTSLKGSTAVQVLSWPHQGLNHRPCGSKSISLTATLQAAIALGGEGLVSILTRYLIKYSSILGKKKKLREVTKNLMVTLAELQRSCVGIVETSRRTTMTAKLQRSGLYGRRKPLLSEGRMKACFKFVSG